jgi:hypothetical protein
LDDLPRQTTGTLYLTANAGDTWLKKPGVSTNIKRLYFFPGSDTGFITGSGAPNPVNARVLPI